MAQIPLFATGLPVQLNEELSLGTVNRTDTTAKNLFSIPKGRMITTLEYWGNAASNAGTTATLSVGLKILNNSAAALGPIVGIVMTGLGAGYTSAPVITFTGGAGSGAAATAVINSAGQVIGITITNPGTGYTSAPTVVFTGGGFTTVATATAVVALGTSLLNASDIKTAATASGQQFPTTNVAALFVPMQFDVMVTGTYAETGTASTAGGPWVIQIYTVLPPPKLLGFYPAA